MGVGGARGSSLRRSHGQEATEAVSSDAQRGNRATAAPLRRVSLAAKGEGEALHRHNRLWMIRPEPELVLFYCLLIKRRRFVPLADPRIRVGNEK